jgi:hypothetical protein
MDDMEGFTETIYHHVIGYRYTGRFDEYAKLVKQAFDELRGKLEDIPEKTGQTIAIYEPKKNEEHVEGFFYVGCIVEAEPSSTVLQDGSEYLRLAGTYACANGTIGQMSTIYTFVEQWIKENGYRQLWPDTLFVERYEFPIPEGDITGEEPVMVMLPIEQHYI